MKKKCGNVFTFFFFLLLLLPLHISSSFSHQLWKSIPTNHISYKMYTKQVVIHLDKTHITHTERKDTNGFYPLTQLPTISKKKDININNYNNKRRRRRSRKERKERKKKYLWKQKADLGKPFPKRGHPGLAEGLIAPKNVSCAFSLRHLA